MCMCPYTSGWDGRGERGGCVWLVKAPWATTGAQDRPTKSRPRQIISTREKDLAILDIK